MPYEPKTLYRGLIQPNKIISAFSPKSKAVIKQIMLTRLNGDQAKITVGVKNKTDLFGSPQKFLLGSKNSGGDSNFIDILKEGELMNFKRFGSYLYAATKSFVNINNSYAPLRNSNHTFTSLPEGVEISGTGLTIQSDMIGNPSTSTTREVIVKMNISPDVPSITLVGLNVNIRSRKYFNSDTSQSATIKYKSLSGSWLDFTLCSTHGVTSIVESDWNAYLSNLSNIDLSKPLELKITLPPRIKISAIAFDYVPYHVSVESPPIPLKALGKIDELSGAKLYPSATSIGNMATGVQASISFSEDGVTYTSYDSETSVLMGKDLSNAFVKIRLYGYTTKEFRFRSSTDIPIIKDTDTYNISLTIKPTTEILTGALIYDYKPSGSQEIIDVSIPMTKEDEIKIIGNVPSLYDGTNLSVVITGYEY